jgi:predicted nucleic acid-binding protein
MSSMPVLTFVDTNVLLYAHDSKPDVRCKLAKELVKQLWTSGAGVLSTQVLQEFYVNAVKTYKLAMAPTEARRAVAAYGRWRIIPTDVELILSAIRLSAEESVSFWDALIIQAALRASATWVVSEDMQDRRRFGTLTVRNPFAG